MRAVADRVTEAADYAAVDAVFVVGEVQARSDLLPQRVTERAVVLQVGARRSGHDHTEVQQAIEADSLKLKALPAFPWVLDEDGALLVGSVA